jgi:hypothetical protein
MPASRLHDAGVMRWEYKRINLQIGDVPQVEFEDDLNALGAQGWELVATLQHARHGYSHEVHLVFKRLVSRDDALAAE